MVCRGFLIFHRSNYPVPARLAREGFRGTRSQGVFLGFLWFFSALLLGFSFLLPLCCLAWFTRGIRSFYGGGDFGDYIMVVDRFCFGFVTESAISLLVR